MLPLARRGLEIIQETHLFAKYNRYFLFNFFPFNTENHPALKGAQYQPAKESKTLPDFEEALKEIER